MSSASDTFDQRVRQIVDEFSTVRDAIDRYRLLVELGDAMPRLPISMRTEEHRLPGCQYDLWIHSSLDADSGAMQVRADSDAKITRGLAALIVRVLDGLTPEDVLEADLAFLDTIGVREHLSVHRSNGLAGMVEEIRARARAHVAAEPRPRSA